MTASFPGMADLAEPFFLCLVASMVWAPIVLALTARFRPGRAGAARIWPLAMLIAALPALAAPVAAALGLSLRAPVPAPAPPPAPAASLATDLATGLATGLALPAAPFAEPAQGSAVTLAAVFEASAALYLYGFLMFMTLGIARRVWFSYRIGYATPMDHPRLEAAFEDWRRRIGVSRKPRYAFTDAVTSVCVHGFFRPVVLMPEALLERVEERDAALMVAHEMAHIRRGDTQLFALCSLVRAVFWFNPFMQRIAAQATLAAEQAADALVIASGVERRRYARCFVAGLRLAADGRFGERALAPSFTPFDRRSRRERLEAILSGRGPSGLTLSARLGLGTGVIAALALAVAQAALAVAPQTAMQPPMEGQPPIEGADATLAHAPVGGPLAAGTARRALDLDGLAQDRAGVDIVAPRGTPVRATGDGKVIEATDRYRGQTAWGAVIVIDHGAGLATRYTHLDRLSVSKGETVSAGQTIGEIGSGGRAQGRAPLHVEVIRNGAPQAPPPATVADPTRAPEPLTAPDPRPAALTPPAPLPGAPLKPADGATTRAPSVPPAVKIANAAPAMKALAAPSPLITAPGAPVATPPSAAASRPGLDESAGGARTIAAAQEPPVPPRTNADAPDADLPDTDKWRAEALKAAEEARASAEVARRNAEEARRNAQERREDAARASAEDRWKAEREREAAQREAARLRAEARREHLAAKLDSAFDDARRDRERALARIERASADHDGPLVSEKDRLAIEERALRNARDDLARRLADVKRRLAELESGDKSVND